MRLFAQVVMKNEEDRYLKAFLWHHYHLFDGIAVYDDQSSDSSVAIATNAGAKVKIRPNGEPSFLDHEGAFRSLAWEWMIEALQPQDGDWVLSLDTDEFLVGPETLFSLAQGAELEGRSSALISIPEIFEIDSRGQFWKRTDGYWDTIKQPRFVKYRPDFLFRNKPMGCGSVPLYAEDNPYLGNNSLSLLHLGYATKTDRRAKYARYKPLTGHAPAHIESILGHQTLEVFEGKTPLLSSIKKH